MAHFRATIQGNRGVASRLGSEGSGITAVINGWDSGIIVEGWYDKKLGIDVFCVTKTGGSNGCGPVKVVYDSSEDE